MRGSVQKVRIAVAMPRAANEKYPPILVVVKCVIAAPRASSIKAKSVAVASIPRQHDSGILWTWYAYQRPLHE